MADTHELPDTGSLSLFADSIPSSTDSANVASESARPSFVPPPVASEIDTLLEAVSLAGRSPLQKSPGDSPVRGAGSPAVRGSSAVLVWRPAMIRGVAPSIAAFLVGAVGALWGLRALPPASPVLLEKAPTTTEVATAKPEPSPRVSVTIPSVPETQPLPPTRSVGEASRTPEQQVAELTTVSATPKIERPAAASSRSARANGVTTRSAEAAPTVLSDSRTRPNRVEAVSAAPLTATPATDLEHLNVGVPEVPQPTVALTAAPPDPTPAVGDRAPFVAEPAVVATRPAPMSPELDPSVEEEHVRLTLHSYETAYEELDVMAAAEVWPSVDRRALSRAFATLKSQGLDFESCAITVRDSQATVYCHGTLQVVRKVGNPVPLKADQQWVFKMRRLAGMWKIDEVSTSQAPVIAAHRVRGEG